LNVSFYVEKDFHVLPERVERKIRSAQPTVLCRYLEKAENERMSEGKCAKRELRTKPSLVWYGGRERAWKEVCFRWYGKREG
jgi:hypothetical protein